MAARVDGVPDAARFVRLRLERKTTTSCAGAGRIAWSGPSPRARPLHIKPLFVLDELGVARVARSEGEQLEVRVACLQHPGDVGCDAYRVQRLQLDDVAVEVRAAGAREADVDLFGLRVSL